MELTRRDFVRAGTYTALAEVAPNTMLAEAPSTPRSPYSVGAYYFPDWHVDPRFELIHGKGWTEWELLKRGEPKFPGHQQPKTPAWGFEDESNPGVFEKKIAAARSAGITHFIFDWYWYEGKPFLESALETGYLRAANKKDVKFCLMWANHDLVNHMPVRLHDLPNPPLIFKASYDPEEFDRVTDHIVSRYFRDPSYFCIDGEPYFSVFQLNHLMDGIGGIDALRKALRRFQEKTRTAGFRGLHLNVVVGGTRGIPGIREVLSSLEVSSVTAYNWGQHYKLPTFPATEYQDALEQAPDYWNNAGEIFGVPYQPDVTVGWDPSPRTCQSDIFQHAQYPFTPILKGNSPELFQRALAKAKIYMDGVSDRSRVLTINAWNEWTEGSYLEPDSVNGMAYLNAIRNVFGA